MSSILDALERASQERMPGRTDILPDTVPVFDENKSVFRRLLLLGILLISIVAAFWFLVGNGANRPETPASTEQTASPVTLLRATPVPGHDGGAVTSGQDRTTVPGGRLSVERIRSSSQPNQRPLVSEARVSEKHQQRKIPETPKPAPMEQVQPAVRKSVEGLTVQLPTLPVVEEKSPTPLPVPIAKEAAFAEKSKRTVTTPEVDNDQVASIESTENDTTGAVQVDQRHIPLIWELDQGLREELEQLRTTIHVYHEKPSERFVIINMRRYGEGDILGANGYRLHTIDKDGIVVDYGNGLVRLLREKY
ncbi:MAG: general secretion pathway protein GspB [Candidatus Thiodiazotropha sp.]